MEQAITHSWALSEEEALNLQYRFAHLVEHSDRLSDIKTVAGVDVAYDTRSNRLIAAAVVMDSSSLNIIEQTIAEDVVRFPYIPGLFSFRELPPIARALHELKNTPDLIVCDGQGIAHPRRFGLACHIGVLFDVPTIGCGKTLLLGKHEPVGTRRANHANLIHGNEVVGNALRTQNGIKPVYVSIGHRVSLATACDWVLRLCTKYRLPETTRSADQLVKKTTHLTTPFSAPEATQS